MAVQFCFHSRSCLVLKPGLLEKVHPCSPLSTKTRVLLEAALCMLGLGGGGGTGWEEGLGSQSHCFCLRNGRLYAFWDHSEGCHSTLRALKQGNGKYTWGGRASLPSSPPSGGLSHWPPVSEKVASCPPCAKHSPNKAAPLLSRGSVCVGLEEVIAVLV